MDIKTRNEEENHTVMEAMEKLRTTSVSEIISNESILRGEGVLVLGNSHTRLMNTCAQKGMVTIKPHPLMNPNLIIQTIANLNRSVVITTSDIWDSIQPSKKYYPGLLDNLSILLLT